MTGGSTSGVVGFPTYMQDYHNEILGNPAALSAGNLVSISNTMLGAPTPYDGTTAIDPSAYLSTISTAVAAMLTSLNAINLRSVFTTEIPNVVSVVDNQANFPKVDIIAEMQLAAVSNAVNKASEVANTAIAGVGVTIETEAKETLYDEIGRLAANAVEINNAQTSSFMIGLALLEAQYQNTVGAAKARLRSDSFNNTVNLLLSADTELAKARARLRGELIDKGASLGAQAVLAKNQLLEGYTRLVIESNRMAIVAESEELSQNIDLDVKSALWDIDVLMRMVQAVGGLGTGTMVPPTTSKAASALGGALSGAATAASLTGNPFIIAGAGILGGLAGLL